MKINFKIDHYQCGDCVKKIKIGLLELPGVSEVEVDPDNERISVVSDRQTSLEDIVKALHEMGYSQLG